LKSLPCARHEGVCGGMRYSFSYS